MSETKHSDRCESIMTLEGFQAEVSRLLAALPENERARLIGNEREISAARRAKRDFAKPYLKPIPDEYMPGLAARLRATRTALAWALAELNGQTKYETDAQRPRCLDQAEAALDAAAPTYKK